MQRGRTPEQNSGAGCASIAVCGSHRGLIFRLIVGTSLIARHEFLWGSQHASPEILRAEKALEHEVSEVLGAFKLLWLAAEDMSPAR
jgi:hypothetical protein